MSRTLSFSLQVSNSQRFSSPLLIPAGCTSVGGVGRSRHDFALRRPSYPEQVSCLCQALSGTFAIHHDHVLLFHLEWFGGTNLPIQAVLTPEVLALVGKDDHSDCVSQSLLLSRPTTWQSARKPIAVLYAEGPFVGILFCVEHGSHPVSAALDFSAEGSSSFCGVTCQYRYHFNSHAFSGFRWARIRAGWMFDPHITPEGDLIEDISKLRTLLTTYNRWETRLWQAMQK
jgi:hypothetical protein